VCHQLQPEAFQEGGNSGSLIKSQRYSYGESLVKYENTITVLILYWLDTFGPV
jgi:hypothetical protein